MNENEVERLRKKYELAQTTNLRLLITSGSDVEAYFVKPDHLAIITGKSVSEMRDLVDEVMHQHMIDFVLAFREKREEIKRELYKQDPDACPATSALLAGNEIPVEKAVGKMLLKRIRDRLQDEGINGGAIIQASSALNDPNLAAVFA